MNKDIIEYNNEIYPVLVENKDFSRYHKVPLGELASIGIGFDSISTAIKNYTTFIGGPEMSAGSGIYKVTVGGGEHLTWSANKNAYIGMARDSANQLSSQAELHPVLLDPTMVFMAVAMMSIQVKLNSIQETQEEILQFLEQKEKAELRGNIIVLNGIIEDYKFNWNNKQFLNNKYNKVLDIKQKAEQSILFAQSRIGSVLGKRNLVHLSTDVNKKVKKLNKAFEDYQLSMYLFALASYVETMLLQNFNKDYMNSVAAKIEQYSIRYRELYTECYNRLEQIQDTAVDSLVLGGIGKMNQVAGEAVAKIPILEKGEIDEVLIGVGGILGDQDGNIKKNKLASFVSKQSSYVTPFVDNIRMIGELYDKPMEVLFDSENLYIEKPVA